MGRVLFLFKQIGRSPSEIHTCMLVLCFLSRFLDKMGTGIYVK